MKLMIQTKVEPAEAEKFVRQMSAQGYEAAVEKCSSDDREDYHFILNGQVHIGYAVTIFRDSGEAWIGIRPE
jgi:hypothetical protein